MSEVVAAVDFSAMLSALAGIAAVIAALLVFLRGMRFLLGFLLGPMNHNGGFIDFPRYRGGL